MDDVVMKRVHRELLSDKPSSKEMEDRRRGHLRTIELEILALSHAPIRDHPNIVKVRSWGFDYPTRDRRMALPVLFMEKASGSLLDLLQNLGSHGLERVPMKTRYQLSMDILEGLICLHKENIVHGDVKPANVLVFRQQNPVVLFTAKISDFGMCVSLEEQSSISYGSYQGTPGWLAPEILRYRKNRGKTIGDVTLSKCDVFSFGLLVLSVVFLTGGPPLKYDVQIEDSAIAAACDLLHKSGGTQAPNLAFGTKMRGFVRSTLEIDPSKRSSLDRHLLAYDCPAFQTCSLDFWSKLDVHILSELDSTVSPTFNPTQEQQLSGDSLFGLATAAAFYRTAGFQKRYVKCVAYAAEASIPAAQGIAGRLLLANGVAEFHNGATTTNWLQNAVSSGSLLAGEDLVSGYPENYQEARKRFRAAGGYNSKLDFAKSSLASVSNTVWPIDTKEAIELCERYFTVNAPMD
ncbi:MAG: hypothetical protein Q9166_004042 [cf. Caloplaca sp. 2 TL-2023]